MRDGVFVSSSQYAERIVTLTLTLISTSEDLAATQLQLLARELDRADNYLMYQPDGATKPVFFRVFRSDIPELQDMHGPLVARSIIVELLCESHALGLRETLGPYTVNNDPAAGSNGHYFDVTGVIGDVAADCVITNTGTHRGGGWLGVRQHGTPSDMAAFMLTQAESMTLGTDTTNPGGGPDAAMSGTGTNNFVRTSFATATMVTRLTWTGALTDAQGLAVTGTYRLLAVVRRSDDTSVMRVLAIAASAGLSATGNSVTIPKDASRQVVDMGLVSFGPPFARVGRNNNNDMRVVDPSLQLQAARDSGTGTLDWDYVVLMPADEALMVHSGGITTGELLVDGLNQGVYITEDGTDPFASTSSVTGAAGQVSGGFPMLVPGQTNRFVHVAAARPPAFNGIAITKGDVGTVTVNYWPAYLYVRPSTT